MNLLPTDTYGWRCESEIRVPSSRGLVKQYKQELCISPITRCITKRFQSRPLKWESICSHRSRRPHATVRAASWDALSPAYFVGDEGLSHGAMSEESSIFQSTFDYLHRWPREDTPSAQARILLKGARGHGRAQSWSRMYFRDFSSWWLLRVPCFEPWSWRSPISWHWTD